MVCTANICRSPLAQGLVMRELLKHRLDGLVEVDSAGTHVFKSGHHPDKRAQQVAKEQGFDIKRLKARKVVAEDFDRFDYILAMDRGVMLSLEAICPESQKHKLSFIMDYSPRKKSGDVPDPYYGNISGFVRVFELLEIACEGLLNHICDQHYFLK